MNGRAQTSQTQVQDPQKKLHEYRAEIQKIEEELRQLNQQEMSTLDQLAQIERKTDLLREYIRHLKSQENRLKQSKFKTRSELLKLYKDLDLQRAVYKQRLIHFYKHKNLGDIELLLSSKSVNQALIWLKYTKQIAQADQRRLRNLINTKNRIEKTNEKHRTEQQKLNGLLSVKAREERRLLQSKNQKDRLLKENRDKISFLHQRKAEKEKEYALIKKLINESSAGNVIPSIDLNKPTEFPRLKGKMRWPVKGRIISRFGTVKNAQNLYDYNVGIEIKSSFGDPVYATCSGVVTRIELIGRIFGKTVTINHYGGYITSYSHLSEVNVSIGDLVYEGKQIGRVGDAGSISGPILLFCVWYNKKEENPINWLSKNPK